MEANDLLTSSKGKLKWEGDLASLRRLFDEGYLMKFWTRRWNGRRQEAIARNVSVKD